MFAGTRGSGGEVLVEPPVAADAAARSDAADAVLATGADGPDGRPPAPAPVDEVAAVPASPLLARLGELPIHLPATSAVVVGYHEAARATAYGLTPVGVLGEDRNTTRTALPPDDPTGTPYLVLSSRGRSAGPTSAVDIVLEPDVAVLAPVTGTVTDVRTYLLYGAHEDLRIEIAPDAHPDLRVVLIHLDAGAVSVGDRVRAGVTEVAGTARAFPFGSHIDRETEPERFPHVHLELQPADAVRPGDEDDASTTLPD